ncbi:hypothetical protein J6590_082184 [Homalodisca vitripennis]|nr:hypothetical protein J6590_082184 [Homalodisca vitripennis]
MSISDESLSDDLFEEDSSDNFIPPISSSNESDGSIVKTLKREYERHSSVFRYSILTLSRRSRVHLTTLQRYR